MTDFIMHVEDVFDSSFCNRAIELYNQMESIGSALTRQQSREGKRHQKDDTSVLLPSLETQVRDFELLKEFNNKFWDRVYNLYGEKFSILQEHALQQIFTYKLQKTEVGQGYHAWHNEAMDKLTSNRLFAWMVYLNDVEEGGETEFLYQHKRYKPKAGDVLLWPSGFTHTHRGNPPLSNTKYIMTGWLEY